MQDRNKNVFPETIVHKIFQTNSGFNVKEPTTGKVQRLFFKRFLLVQAKLSIWH